MTGFQKTIIKIDNKVYKLVCSVEKNNYTTYPHLEVKSKLFKGQFPFRPYNNEDLERSYGIQAAKKIKQKNKEIDRHQRHIDFIIQKRSEIDLEMFIYDSLYEFIDNIQYKQEEEKLQNIANFILNKS